MWALVDANSFFASVEKVFHPGLKGKPVVVLSSNDGIIVALTPEAKKIGLHRGDPIFNVKDIVNRHNVAVFSTNMMLYAAMSKRVAGIIKQSVERVDQCSIDECLADLSGYESHYDLEEYMRGVADRIRLWTDIPVSVGIAPTKTLDKIGSKFAKQYKGYGIRSPGLSSVISARAVCRMSSLTRLKSGRNVLFFQTRWTGSIRNTD